jgi:hypothetical protein
VSSIAWVIPGIVALLSGTALAWVASHVVTEVKRLHDEMQRFSVLRPALIELRDLTAQTRMSARSLRHHR